MGWAPAHLHVNELIDGQHCSQAPVCVIAASRAGGADCGKLASSRLCIKLLAACADATAATRAGARDQVSRRAPAVAVWAAGTAAYPLAISSWMRAYTSAMKRANASPACTSAGTHFLNALLRDGRTLKCAGHLPQRSERACLVAWLTAAVAAVPAGGQAGRTAELARLRLHVLQQPTFTITYTLTCTCRPWDVRRHANPPCN
jgi:hypothetical protein